MARFDGGYIKFHRRCVHEDIGKRLSLLGVWVTLLSYANRFETRLPMSGKQVVLPPGSTVIGIRELAEKFDCSRDTISRALKYLEETGRIRAERRPRGVIVTICNWSEYQELDESGRPNLRQTPAERRPLAGHSPALTGEEENRRSNTNTVSKGEVEACIKAWQATLSRLGVQKEAKNDEANISRLIARYGAERTRLALLGAGFEAASKDYDPRKHVSIRRLIEKPGVFDTFENLGAAHKPAPTEPVEWSI